MTYDAKCWTLAQGWLVDTSFPDAALRARATERLAQAIQTAIEDALPDILAEHATGGGS